MSEAKLSPAKGSAESPWATWSKVDVADEIRHRMAHFYLQTDGTMKFPNSAEGDILKMVHVLFSPNTKAHFSKVSDSERRIK